MINHNPSPMNGMHIIASLAALMKSPALSVINVDMENRKAKSPQNTIAIPKAMKGSASSGVYRYSTG